jgi:hypothetical protein
MPTVRVGFEERKRISHGQSIKHPAGEKPEDENPAGSRTNYASGTLAKLCDKKNQLIAIAEFEAGETLWRPRVVLID